MSDEDGVWYLPSPLGEGSFVVNAHRAWACEGTGCPLHSPSDHWARDMPLRWFEYSMQRLCPHGEYHDDPDDLAYRQRNGLRTPGRERDCSCGCPCDCPGEAWF